MSNNKVIFNGKEYEVVGKRRDITAYKAMVERQVYLIKCELIRLANEPHRDVKNTKMIRAYDEQVRYLEEVLAAYERDQKAAT